MQMGPREALKSNAIKQNVKLFLFFLFFFLFLNKQMNTNVNHRHDLKKNAPVFGVQGQEGKVIGSFFKIKSVIDIFFACFFFLTFKRGKRKASTFNLSTLLLIKLQRQGKKKRKRNNFRFCLIICKQSVQRKHCSCTTIILLKYCPYDVKPYLIYQSTDRVIFYEKRPISLWVNPDF